MPKDKYEKKFGAVAGGISALGNRKLSEFGAVHGDVFTIRGPEVIKGSGIRAADIGIAAAAAGAIYYQMGKDGKKIKTPSPSSDVSVPTQLQGKRTPTQLRGKAHGGKVHTKAYATGGGIRKARTYG
jgi:hypothetical protein